MPDVHSKATRSYNMSRIRSKDTKPEIIVRKFLHGKGLRYRLHVKNMPGKPDIVLSKHKIAIFVNGCFWHGHTDCKYFKLPLTRAEWWFNKINKNKENDFKSLLALDEQGWKTIIIWECHLKANTLDKTLKSLLSEFS